MIKFKSVKSAQNIGRWGESIARKFLETKGYKFIDSNWSCKLGEIDLIMDDPSNSMRRPGDTGTVRVFIEVKVRSSASYGDGLDVVAWQKQRKLIRTVRQYMQQEDHWSDVRFDVVSIQINENSGFKIDHIDYAFDMG